MGQPQDNRRRMTAAGERRAAAPRFPWGDMALSPIDGLLAAVPAVTFVALPLYVALWLAGDGAPERWAGFVLVSAFAFGMGRTVFTFRSARSWGIARASTTTCSTTRSRSAWSR